MQVSATGNAPITPRQPQLDPNSRADLDRGRDAASRQSPEERAASRAQADQARASQAETARAVEPTGRGEEPEPVNLATIGGAGQVRGSRLDITV